MHFIKNNKYIILSIVLMIALIGISFFQFYKETFSYATDYYKIKEYCYEKKDVNHKYCKVFKNEQILNKYIESSNPQKIYKKYDTITLTCTIVEDTLFNIMQYFSPLLLALALLGTIHSTFSSGMFQNYLMRENYKSFLKKIYVNVFKVALIIPLSLVIIFVIAAIFSNFNFDTSNVDKGISVYNEWKYNNFLLYGILICLIQFVISIFYSHIALFCCNKNKNMLVAIIMSYISFILMEIIIYIGIYCIFINSILGFTNLTDCFNIAGYWFFNEQPYYGIYALIISIILSIISFAIIYNNYKNKEKVVLSYERKIS